MILLVPAGSGCRSAAAPDSGNGSPCGDLHWADGGRFSPRARLEPVGLPTYRFFSVRISDRGAILAMVGLEDGGSGHRLFRGGKSPVDVSATVRDLLADDSWIDCPRRDDAKCYRTAADGSIISALPLFDVDDATVSGWATGRDLGTVKDNVVVVAPDGGRWAYPTSFGAVLALNEAGMGVGQFRATQRLMVWRNGSAEAPAFSSASPSAWGADVNATGLIGGERLLGGVNRAAVFCDTELVDLPLRWGTSAEVLAVNDRNVAVGVERDASGDGRGFVWSRGEYHLIDELLTDAGCSLTAATDINNSNQVVGRAQCGAGPPVTVRVDLE